MSTHGMSPLKTLERQDRDIMHTKSGKQEENLEKHAEEVKESAKMVEDR